MQKEIDIFVEKNKQLPNIIFLQNHGLIVSSNNLNDIIGLTEKVLLKIENYLNIDLSKYKLCSTLSNTINDKNLISYISDDFEIKRIVSKNKNLLMTQVFCPDKLVYCGINTIELIDIKDSKAIDKYKNKYFETPKIVLYKEHVFIIANNIRKAKEIEDVLKFNLLTIENTKNEQINYLDFDELAYLSNWEAEQYRQKK